jgi:uncharacterized protein YecE (DUF72 family)
VPRPRLLMPVMVGTSGWQYRHWRETFYPRGVAQSRWLEYYAERFATVESNAAFYRLPEADTFAAWSDRTPADFVMAVKASRYLTHIRRLADPAEAVERFVGRASRLGGKLGPVLLQLPPSMKAAPERLSDTLDRFPRSWRVAVEFRHRSWFTDDVRALLEEYGAALCLADRRGPLTPLWRTTDWTYLRFHSGRAKPEPCYGRQALAGWIRRLSEHWRPEEDVYVYFNNDPRACALRDARFLAIAAHRAGLRPTRIPAAADVRLG